MTATEELRRMLDERGVEWMDDSYGQLWSTVWHGSDGNQWRMNENRSGMLTELRAWNPTPEQAVETTLGRDQLQAENAKLREEIAKARDPQRIGGQADPSSFVYAIEQLREFRWQHATNDEDAIPYINNVAAAHERENAKLRELVRDMWSAYHDGATNKEFRALPDRMRELGIEVDS